MDKTKTAVCPCCGRQYHGRPALSRKDNKTSICPDCGTREALDSIGVDLAEQEEIVSVIHRCMERQYNQNMLRKWSDAEEITVKEILEIYVQQGRRFHFMTPAGYVDLSAEDAEKILRGEMNPKAHPGTIEYAVEIEKQELFDFRCMKSEIRNCTIDAIKEECISAFVR